MVEALQLGGLAIVVSLIPTGTLCALKGRRTLLIAGLCGLFPVLWVGAVRIAAPESWWARRFYSEAKLERARATQERWLASWSE